MAAGISKLAMLPVSLPTTPLPKDVDPQDISERFAGIFSIITEPISFVQDAVWRDSFCLTGTMRTFYSAEGVTRAWQAACLESARPIDGTLTILREKASMTKLPNGSGWIDVIGDFAIRTRNGLVGNCKLILSVVRADEGGEWKIWSLRTVLQEVEGWPSVNHYPPQINGTINGTRESGHSHVNGNSSKDVALYHDVIIVGGGQAGLSVAGRLQALGVEYVLMDKYKRIGDSWGSRYDSARLHTIREYSHLPFDRTFTKDDYQEFLTKDDLARGYRDWAKKFGIADHVWAGTELLSGVWDHDKHEWTLKILKGGDKETVRCRFVVMATGAGGQIPYMPDLPGRDQFTGVVLHSQQYSNPKAWKGKRGIIVGTANTAHDVADDMLEVGLASVTMIQRSPTYVMPYEYWQKISSRLYNENVPTELADMLQMSGPMAVGRLLVNSGLHAMAKQEPERFDALERSGFKTVRYGDLMFNLAERAGGHYMDVGTSQKIADGKISIKSDARATHYTTTGLGFSDGTEIPADVIVWATGFERNLRDSVRKLLGEDVAAQIEDFLGINDEGETKGAWKLQHPGLITHGAALGQARYYSKYIAIQIKAALDGKPFCPYLDTPALTHAVPTDKQITASAS